MLQTQFTHLHALQHSLSTAAPGSTKSRSIDEEQLVAVDGCATELLGVKTTEAEISRLQAKKHVLEDAAAHIDAFDNKQQMLNHFMRCDPIST